MAAIWIPKRLVSASLVNTAALSGKELVRRCELEYDNRVMRAAGEVLASGSKIVMLTGPSASGKTTTAHKLAHALQLRGLPTEVLSLDNFYKNKDSYPRLPDGSKDYENVTALDIDCIHACQRSLVETGCCDAPIFDFFKEERKAETLHIDLNGGVIIMEGIHALNPLLTEGLPEDSYYKIYAGLREEYAGEDGRRVLPTRDLRLARRMTRDSADRGHGNEKTLSMWASVCAGEDRYIKVFKAEANLLLDTSFSYEPCALAPRITSLVGTLPDSSPYVEMLNDLAGRFAAFEPLPEALVPANSMLREFLGSAEESAR